MSAEVSAQRTFVPIAANGVRVSAQRTFAVVYDSSLAPPATTARRRMAGFVN